MQFIDPLTKYSSLGGYLFKYGALSRPLASSAFSPQCLTSSRARSISFLRTAFSPVFTLHNVTRTGDLELTTRWTMEMRVSPPGPLAALWSPRLLFTGRSIMRVDAASRKFVSHVDCAASDATEQGARH